MEIGRFESALAPVKKAPMSGANAFDSVPLAHIGR